MVVDSNDNGNTAECTECEPPRRFKSKAGLNGHVQFKHGHLPDSRAVTPNGKQSQMYQDLTDRVNQVLDRQDDIFDYLKHGNGDGNGLANGNGQGNGNGNGQDNGNGNGQDNGNGSDFSNERIGVVSRHPDAPDDEDTYNHEDCGAPLEKLQRRCGDCGEQIDWSGLTDSRELPLQMPRL